jgi:hypothetical protein
VDGKAARVVHQVAQQVVLAPGKLLLLDGDGQTLGVLMKPMVAVRLAAQFAKADAARAGAVEHDHAAAQLLFQMAASSAPSGRCRRRAVGHDHLDVARGIGASP